MGSSFMSPCPGLEPLPACDYAAHLRDVFVGSYSPSDERYHVASINAPQPLDYQPVMVQFCFLHNPDRDTFTLDKPVTVTIEELGVCHFGHALYGHIRKLVRVMDTIRWPGQVTIMTVEVHSIPDFEVNWHHAVPWPHPPEKAVFIQPHGFTRDGYRPVPLYLATSDTVKHVTSYNQPLPYEWEFNYCLAYAPGEFRLPAPCEYPSQTWYDSEGNVIEDAGIDDAEEEEETMALEAWLEGMRAADRLDAAILQLYANLHGQTMPYALPWIPSPSSSPAAPTSPAAGDTLPSYAAIAERGRVDFLTFDQTAFTSRHPPTYQERPLTPPPSLIFHPYVPPPPLTYSHVLHIEELSADELPLTPSSSIMSGETAVEGSMGSGETDADE